MLTPMQIQNIVQGHEAYWNGLRSDLKAYSDVYKVKFWQASAQKTSVLRTETPAAFKMVESYLGALFAKNPSVHVGADLRGKGNPEVVGAVSNQFLLTARPCLEDATRLALIYPCSFLKLAPILSPDPLRRVSVSAVPPWEVIVDATAASWDSQRWIGHVSLLPLAEAATRFSKDESEFSHRQYSRWLDTTYSGGRSTSATGMTATPTHHSELGTPAGMDPFVQIVELYDLVNDKLIVWSADYLNGSEYLFSGVKIQMGGEDAEEAVETTGIPYKTSSGRSLVPIIPLYFARDPDVPLRGMSLIGRSYDQFRELAVMRTYSAQGVRRMARQWLMRAGFLSDESIEKIQKGLDGEIIEVDVPPGTELEGNFISVPNEPIPADIIAYAATIENDIREAGLMAPFARGEVSGVTATENSLLAQYTSSEVGRMARTRDESIVQLAQTYSVMLSVILGDEAEPLSLPNPIGPTMLSAEDLTGDFQYSAADQGTTPMSDMAKQQSLTSLAPLLVQLGADPATILSEIVRAYQFSAKLAEAAKADEAPTEATPIQEGV